jgi:hypothetical protein
MKNIGLLPAVLSSMLVCAAVAESPAPPQPAAPQPAAPQVQIPFADRGGIYNWQVVNDRTVLIQGQNRKWYKATLMSACIDLPFAQRLGFESNADGSFDRFSSIQVREQKCPLVSLVETSPPAKKAKKPGAAAASPAAAAPASPPAAAPAARNPTQ